MMRRVAACVALGALAVGACRPTAPVRPTPTATAQDGSSPKHAPEIRIGLIGGLHDQNVWGLFAGQGYSYNDYATRAEYWPRLYAITNRTQEFEARLAAGMPTAILPEGAFYTATVPIRTDVKWSDGSIFRAQDAAFTVNAVLQFEMGFDWADFYDRKVLDHAEAVSNDQLKFYFKSMPSVRSWQMGALRGPIVQAAYWSAKVAAAGELLPSAGALARIHELEDKVAGLQDVVNGLYAQSLSAQGEQAREVQATLRRQQGNLDEAINDLSAAEDDTRAALESARGALFHQADSGEPLLGPWLPAGGPGTFTAVRNEANSDYPGPAVNFDRAIYVLYSTAEAAREALAAGEVNVVLNAGTHATGEAGGAMVSPTRSVRFVLLNVHTPGLDDPAVRSALACSVDQTELAGRLTAAVPLFNMVQPEESAWYSGEAAVPCAGADEGTRLAEAVGILRTAGYVWGTEPAEGRAGSGLARPDGSPLGNFRLLAPATDDARAAAADYLAEVAGKLGIAFEMQLVTADELNYAVLSSGDFDAAIMGWRSSAYPGYLCEWFGAGGLFATGPGQLAAACGELDASSDLAEARASAGAMQRGMLEELPLVPLYAEATYDALKGIAYPFTSVMDGLTGVFGAPEAAYSTAP